MNDINEWVRSTPVVVLLVLAALVISSIITISGGAAWAVDQYTNHFRWREGEYDKLKALHAGFSIEKFTEVLGSPTFVTRSPDGSLTEGTFRGRDYWVQAVYDSSGLVKLFAITSCSAAFRPTFTSYIGKITLNESHMNETSTPPTRTLYFLSGATANSYFFDEYAGENPSFYKTFLLGINDACPAVANDVYTMAEKGEIPFASPRYNDVAFSATDEIVRTFRERSVANTYAETAPGVALSEVGGPFQIGVNRILTRTVQEHQPPVYESKRQP